mmetsp:Transcript_21159/g.9715  ORF Transcript_21159/g.9715 Transcript_21159/m.9715 type:complete len:110 (-) Transcript_21159:815-1144(-)
MLPSGVIRPEVTNIIGNGVVVHLPSLFDEMDKLEAHRYQLLISNRAHLTTSWHLLVDETRETTTSTPIGTTKKGIGPTYASKATRNGLRMGDLLHPSFEVKYRALLEEV